MIQRIEALNYRSLRYILFFYGLCLFACAAGQLLNPSEAQANAQAAWDHGWHGQWALAWPEAPYYGSIVFEGWQTEAGRQRRYEILEAEIPSFVGLTYLNDGQTAHHFNRLDPTVPVTEGDATLTFAPVTAALARISAQLAELPQSAQQRAIDLPGGPGFELRLGYGDQQTLTLWLDPQTHLILKADLISPADHLTLIARSLEPLTDPHPDLFKLIE